MERGEEPTGPFSDLPFRDLAGCLRFIIDTHADLGLGVEALDCILGEVANGGTIEDGIRLAICEWDL